MGTSGELISINTYDTYGSGSDVSSLATALTNVKSGYFIALVTYDATSLDSGIRTAINNNYYGTLSDTWGGARKAHVFIGKKR